MTLALVILALLVLNLALPDDGIDDDVMGGAD